MRQVRAINYYEFDEYWIKDRFGNDHKLTAVIPPKPVPSSTIRLSAGSDHATLPYDQQTVDDIEAMQNKKIDRVLEIVMQEAEKKESDEELECDSDDSERSLNVDRF